MENKFCDYLVNIGLVDIKTGKNLKDVNHDIAKSKNNQNFSDSFFISLMEYLNNLTENQKKYMSLNLPLRFLLNIEKEKKQKLLSLLSKKEKDEKYIKLKYLFAWMKNSKIKKTSNPISKETSGISLINNKMSFDEFMNGRNKKGNEIKYKYINNKYGDHLKNKMRIKKISSYNNSYYSQKANDIIKDKEILTTEDKKELLQLSECTFKPSINNTANNSLLITNANSEFHSTFEKLYKDSEKYRIKKNIKAIEYEHMLNKDLTFKPNLCETPKSISNMKFEKFEIRQQNFLNYKNLIKNKLKKNIENSVETRCSFSPKINSAFDFIYSSSTNKKHNITTNEDKNLNSNSNTNNNNCESYYSISTVKTIPAYVRLYDDSKRRNNSFIQKEIEYKKSINEMANRTSKKFYKVDYEKIRSLSGNKEKKLIYEKTRKKVEEEEGITFKPILNLNNKYIGRIKGNFYERNKIDKKNSIFENFTKFEEKDRKKTKKYTEEEKKQIVSNIVKRLYNESLDKNLKKRIEYNNYNNYNDKNDLNESNMNKLQISSEFNL